MQAIEEIRRDDLECVREISSVWEKALLADVSSENLIGAIHNYLGSLEGNEERIKEAFKDVSDLAHKINSSLLNLYIEANKADHLVQTQKILRNTLYAAVLKDEALRKMAVEMRNLLLSKPTTLINMGC